MEPETARIRALSCERISAMVVPTLRTNGHLRRPPSELAMLMR
jgi:hypothetical protein